MSASEGEPYLRVEGVTADSGGFALGPVSFQVSQGGILAILGPNGAGKTTLLRVLAGLEPALGGRVILGGEDLTNRPAHRRGVGLVFQDLALFPNRSVVDNIAYGLEVRHESPEIIEPRVEELLTQFRLRALADRLPQALSGGERQRVALARALAPRPALLLLDEPLASVDYRLRRELQGELKRWLSETRTTVVHVTHDFEEAFFLGDRVGVMKDGRWIQEGTPSEVYSRPASRFVAWFLGYNTWKSAGGWTAALPTDVELTVGGDGSALTGRVEAAGALGEGLRVVVRFEEPPESRGTLVEVRLVGPPGGLTPTPGDRVHLHCRKSITLPQELGVVDPLNP